MSANLEQLMFKLKHCILILGHIIFHLTGPDESRSGMWLEFYKKPPPVDLPRRKYFSSYFIQAFISNNLIDVLGDEDPCAYTQADLFAYLRLIQSPIGKPQMEIIFWLIATSRG